jgi:hypothetical protein
VAEMLASTGWYTVPRDVPESGVYLCVVSQPRVDTNRAADRETKLIPWDSSKQA